MAKDSDSLTLLPDDATKEPENDQLGYNDFSEQISDAIDAKIPNTEFVIGIYGAWGSGKSSILNFVTHHLENKENPPLIIRFNPWWFSDQNDLIKKFILQLKAGLGKENGFEEVRDKLSTFASVLSVVPYRTLTGIPLGKPLQRLSNIVGTDNSSVDVGDLKQEISDSLLESEREIVVMVDDIDRLTDTEIRQMFRLVKSVADFPNITYVLAFDQSVVTDALEGIQGIQSGDKYLNKVVQLPLHIPIPEENAIHTMFTNRLDLIAEEATVGFNENRWQRLYRSGIRPVLDTPRDAVKLSNAIEISHKAVGDEVNFIDLVGIETLRIFFREAYEEIRDDRERFTTQKETLPSQQGSNGNQDYKDLYQDNLEDEEKEALRHLLGNLFPRVGAELDGRFPQGDPDSFRGDRRVCDPEMIKFYFRLTLPSGELSTSAIEDIINITDDADLFSKELLRLSERKGTGGKSQAYLFLDIFSKRLDKVPDDNIEPIVIAIFSVGDLLIERDESRGTFRMDIGILLKQIVWELIERMNP